MNTNLVKTFVVPFSTLVIALSCFAAKQSELVAVPFTDVQIDSEFWAPRIKLNREKIVPHDLKFCEGRINNFAKAGGLMPGKFEGTFFDDSDVYKVIEGAAYSLSQQRDPELEKTIDDVIDKIAAAQRPDGYLYTFYTVNKTLDLRWTKREGHARDLLRRSPHRRRDRLLPGHRQTQTPRRRDSRR